MIFNLIITFFDFYLFIYLFIFALLFAFVHVTNYYYYNARTNTSWEFILHSASDVQETALQCPLDNRLSHWSGRTISARWKGTQTDAPAGLLRPTLLEEPPGDVALRLLALAL